ncbi:hypothetical protein [uncultured Nostoc sp.]|uniref:hypothetical protein n=1 Tax=uncultured Nostoc sp. TaxID=340711 RepID=UPI0035CB1D35
MFEIKLQETRAYQEAKEEGLKQALEEIREKGREQAKLKLIPRFLAYVFLYNRLPSYLI